MDAFAAGITGGLVAARLGHVEVCPYASPRRLSVVIDALDTCQADREVTQKGPPVSIALDEAGKPTKAGLAFAKKCGVEFGALIPREKQGRGMAETHVD